MNLISPTPSEIVERRKALGLKETEAARVVSPEIKNKNKAHNSWHKYESGKRNMPINVWVQFCNQTEQEYVLNRTFNSPTREEIAARRIASGLSKADAGRIISPDSNNPSTAWLAYESGRVKMSKSRWRHFYLKTEELHLQYSKFIPASASQLAARRIASGLSKADAGRIVSPDAINPCSVWCSYESGGKRISSKRWKLFYIKTEEIFSGLSQQEQKAFTKTETHLLQPEYA